MVFPILQMVSAAIIIVLILLQERSSGLGALTGGGGGDGGAYQTRRGLERIIFYATIVMIVIFVGLAIAQLVW